MRTFPLSLLLAGLMAGASVAPAAAQSTTDGRVGPSLAITGNGRALTPAGRLTVLGDFPSGGALSPDGRFYWAIDSGLGHNDAKIVDVASGSVVQSLPLPGTYGAVAWHSVHGADSTPPPPGPNASILEHERALGALAVLRHGGDVRRWLDAAGGAGDDEGEQPGGWGAIARGAIHAGSPPGVGSGP